jgi:hypothetical protein
MHGAACDESVSQSVTELLRPSARRPDNASTRSRRGATVQCDKLHCSTTSGAHVTSFTVTAETDPNPQTAQSHQIFPLNVVKNTTYRTMCEVEVADFNFIWAYVLLGLSRYFSLSLYRWPTHFLFRMSDLKRKCFRITRSSLGGVVTPCSQSYNLTRRHNPQEHNRKGGALSPLL